MWDFSLRLLTNDTLATCSRIVLDAFRDTREVVILPTAVLLLAFEPSGSLRVTKTSSQRVVVFEIIDFHILTLMQLLHFFKS